MSNSQFACEECRGRKFRCSKDRPACAYCVRHGKSCVYSGKISRSPLTREYVTSLETRLRELETIVAHQRADGGFNSVLSPQQPSMLDFNVWSKSGSAQQQQQQPLAVLPAKVKERRGEGAPDTLPVSSNGFEWAEQEDSTCQIADGMAALSVDPQGAGYLGSSANVALLRSLQRSGWSVESPLASPGAFHAGSSSMYSTWNLLSQPASHRQMRASLIEAYFHHYHTTYPIVHEATFRAQYNEVIPKPAGSAWTLLRNTIISIGAWCLGHDLSGISGGLLGPDPHGLNKFPDLFSTGNLTMVQALALWSNYTQRQNRPNTSWNYQGLAVRMALSLGLHREFPAWNISLLDREMRRRVWWYLYVVDSGASMTFGRPILLPDSDIMDIKLILNVDDEYLTAATTEAPEESSEPTLYSSLLTQTKFHLKVNSMYTRRLANPDLSVEEVLSMNSQISSWMLTLPSYYQEDTLLPNIAESLIYSRTRFFWRVRNFRMLLLWPVLLHYTEKTRKPFNNITPDTDTEKERLARQLCLSYAHDTITSVDEYFSSGDSRVFGDWYALYYLVQSSLIPIIAMLNVPESPEAPLWTSDVETAKRILGSVVTHHELARKFLDIVNRFWSPLDAAMFGGSGEQSLLLDQIYTQITADSSEPQFLWQGMYEARG